MDGYEFLRELRRRPVHPPVVAMSGLASKDDLRRAREAGFHAHIKKPFAATAVIAAVQAAVRHRKEQPPAGIAEPHPARTERRFAPRGAGDGAGRPVHGKTMAASRDDDRERARRSPK
jgi:DNA-binding response OmpR family regulator